MKCPKCKGCGMMDVDDGIFTIHGYDCDYCLGTGYIEPITNEEYIRSCSVEELAEFLCKVAMTDILWDRIRQVYYEEGKQAVMEWLKEKHE